MCSTQPITPAMLRRHEFYNVSCSDIAYLPLAFGENVFRSNSIFTAVNVGSHRKAHIVFVIRNISSAGIRSDAGWGCCKPYRHANYVQQHNIGG